MLVRIIAAVCVVQASAASRHPLSRIAHYMLQQCDHLLVRVVFLQRCLVSAVCPLSTSYH